MKSEADLGAEAASGTLGREGIELPSGTGTVAALEEADDAERPVADSVLGSFGPSASGEASAVDYSGPGATAAAADYEPLAAGTPELEGIEYGKAQDEAFARTGYAKSGRSDGGSGSAAGSPGGEDALIQALAELTDAVRSAGRSASPLGVRYAGTEDRLIGEATVLGGVGE